MSEEEEKTDRKNKKKECNTILRERESEREIEAKTINIWDANENANK